jgi:hypothetical protein
MHLSCLPIHSGNWCCEWCLQSCIGPGENLRGSLEVIDMIAGIPALEVGFSLCTWPVSLWSETGRPLTPLICMSIHTYFLDTQRWAFFFSCLISWRQGTCLLLILVAECLLGHYFQHWTCIEFVFRKVVWLVVFTSSAHFTLWLVTFEVAVVAIEIRVMRRITFAIPASCERSCGFGHTRRTFEGPFSTVEVIFFERSFTASV